MQKYYKQIKIACFSTLIILLLTVTGYAQKSEIGQVLGEEVNIRSEPDKDSSSLIKLAPGTEIEIISSNDQWYYVSYDGIKGYIRDDLVFVRALAGKTAYVIKDGVNLRGGPGDSTYVVDHIQGGEAVRVQQMVGDWCYVLHGENKGFVRRNLLLLTNQSGDQGYELFLKRDMSGSEVKRLQRELIRRNFLSKDKDTGTYGSLTVNAVQEFQEAAGIKPVDGVAGPETMRALYDRTNNIVKKIEEPKTEKEKEVQRKEKSKSLADQLQGNVDRIDWWKGGNRVLKRPGGVATVYDVSTGRTFRIRRTGGNKHNDVVPMTAADTKIMKSIVGSWSWERRAIVVMTSGGNYAASMNSMPHSPDPQKNDNYPGHFCVHFTNSRTHGGNRVDPDHKSAINRAYNKFN